MSVDFRIVDFNYPFQPAIQFLETSEDPSFPVENVGDHIRGKTWRSYGYFEITSSNKYIDFKESGGGAELTATLTEGNYTTAQLETELKSELELSSTNGRTYTVSFSRSTGLWTITGETFLSLLWSTGTNTANSVHTSLGFATTDLTGGTSYVAANIALHTVERVTVDLLSAEAIDTFALLFDPMEGIQFSDNATLKLKGNATNEWSSPAVEVTLSVDEDKDSLTHFFTSDQEYRYWCVEITDVDNHDLYVEIGTIILGNATTLTRAPDQKFKFRLDDQSKKQENDYGHEYIDQYPTRKRLDFGYNILSYSQLETLDDIYRRVSTKIPVFCALDTAEEMFDKDHFTIYGRMQKSMSQDNLTISYFKTKYSVEESM